MAVPIPFSVATAQRSGDWQKSFANFPSGYTQLYYEYAIPNLAEYENTANTFEVDLVVNGVVQNTQKWQGNSSPNKFNRIGDPVPFFFDISQIPAGATVDIKARQPNVFTSGIQNGLIS